MIPTKLARRLIAAVIYTAMISLPGSAHADLETQLNDILQEEGLAGISWATITPEGGTKIGSAGLKHIPNRLPFSPETLVHVGSVTKTLLATGILRLVSEGKLDLYAPVKTYIPGLKFDNPWHATSAVKLRHLLDHTAGLNDAYLWQMFSNEIKPDTPLSLAFTRTDTALQVRSRPGMRLSYSNMGYTLLGLIIERVTGERYETYLDRELLAPLGMHNSSFQFTAQVENKAGYNANLAWGHFDDGQPAEAMPMILRPAGQFTTTAGDMAKFMTFLMGDGTIDGKQFISADLMQARGIALGTEASSSGLEAGYALGLGRRDRLGTIGLCHRGNVIGFNAMMCVYPADKKAFFYSVNTDSETADYNRLEEAFVGHLKPTQASTPEMDLMAPDIKEWEGVYTFAPNRFQSFELLDTMANFAEVSLKKGTFLFTPFQGNERVLHPTGDYIFSASDRTTNSHIFMLDENGNHIISDGFTSYKKTNPAVVYGPWFSLGLALAGLVWIIGAVGISFIRHGKATKQHPLYLPFIAALSLVVPAPFFMMQPFMAIGDITLAGVLLATATLGLAISLVLAQISVVRGERTQMGTIHGLASLAVLQFCGLLFYHGMMPLMVWTL